jgi:hypothetical protein
MANTTNFNWETPDDTDLVKDGAAAIRTLGNSIDTSMMDLKGGTTGQVLSKTSNTDMDFTWIANDQGDITEVQAGSGISVSSGTGPIPIVTNTVATAFDAKGDLIGGTGADTFSRLAVGTNGQILTADSTTSTGLKWAAASAPSAVGCSLTAGAETTIANATFTAVAFSVEKYDTDNFHSTSTNTSRITIPSGKAGKYLITGKLNFNSNATGYRQIAIYKNGSSLSYNAFAVVNGNVTGVTIVSLDSLAEGDYLELFGYQTSGGNLNTESGSTATSFGVVYLGA